MGNLFDDLLRAIKIDNRFFDSEGELLRNSLYEAGMKLDNKLLSLLLNNKGTKDAFFSSTDTCMVFDKIKFGWVVSNQQFLPSSYTRFKNRIGLIDKNEEYLTQKNDVTLAWPYKDCVLVGGQKKDDEKRDEIFYNETLAVNEIDYLLASKVLSNPTKIDSKSEYSISNYNEGDNLIIKGNNLIVISTLLHRFEKKIKCIYIDPPYNPRTKSNTFSYNNSFNRSTWLTFMKNRLEVSKRLLTEDGVLIVAIDKNEQPYLQVLIDEIFKEYDSDCITIVHNPRGTQGTNFSYNNEYAIFVTKKGVKSVLDRKLSTDEIEWVPLRNWGGESLRTDAKNCFYPIIVKDSEILGFGPVEADDFHPLTQTVQKDDCCYVYPIDSDGVERKWRYSRQSVENIRHLLRVKQKKNRVDIEIGKDFGLLKTVWTDPKYDANAYGKQLIKKYVPNSQFTFPKSLFNVHDCVFSVVGNDKNAIVLDFFAGSGTTAHALMMMNKSDGGKRQFILCDQMDYIETETIERVKNVIRLDGYDEEFTYIQLKGLNEIYIEKIQKCEDDKLDILLEEIVKSAYINHLLDVQAITSNLDGFNNLDASEKRRILFELLDKNMIYINLSEIDDEEYEISDLDKLYNSSFYSI